MVRLHQRRRRHDRPGQRRGRARGRWASRSRNSFAVDDDGRRVHRHRRGALPLRGAAPTARPRSIWREAYENSGVAEAGAGERRLGHDADADGRATCVAITDNADPMNVARLPPRRAACRGARRICRAARVREGRERDRPVADRRRPLARGREQLRLQRARPRRSSGGTTVAGPRARRPRRRGGGCRSRLALPPRPRRRVVPKLSVANGLVYTYTKEPQPRTTPTPGTSRRSTSAPAAPSTSGSAARASATTTTTRRSRSAPTAPPTSACSAASFHCAIACRRRGRRRPVVAPACGGCGCTCGGWGAGRRARVRVLGGGTRLVRRVDFYRGVRRVARDRRRPFARVVRVGRGRVTDAGADRVEGRAAGDADSAGGCRCGTAELRIEERVRGAAAARRGCGHLGDSHPK